MNAMLDQIVGRWSWSAHPVKWLETIPFPAPSGSCHVCGGDLVTGALFCSVVCKAEFQRGRRRVDVGARTCAVCRQAFERKVGQPVAAFLAQQTCLSPACYSENMRRAQARRHDGG